MRFHSISQKANLEQYLQTNSNFLSQSQTFSKIAAQTILNTG